MTPDQIEKIDQLLKTAFGNAAKQEIFGPINLANLGSLIKEVDENFSTLNYGHEKLRPLLEEIPAVVGIIKDDSISPPRFFAEYLPSHETSANRDSLPPPIKHQKIIWSKRYPAKSLQICISLLSSRVQNGVNLQNWRDESFGGLPLIIPTC